MIEAINLTKQYEDSVLALDDLNLKVEKGKIFCLLGANGAGKTTTINLFLNFIEPTKGKALINNIDINSDPLDAKKYVAYVSENVMLYSNFSARQNLDFFAKLGGKKDLKKEDYYNILDKVGLSRDSFDNKVKNFSKGMRQKLGIAIAYVKDARALFLDEPTSGLDPKAASEFLTLLNDLRSSDKAIFMSTHDIFRTKEIADNIGIMKKGKLLVNKTKEDLKHENIEKIYIEYMEE